MKLNTIIERMPIWYETGISYFLTSAPGRGKTMTVSRVPEIVGKKLGKNLGFVHVNAALSTPMDILGYGLPKHTETHSLLVFSKPFFWITAEGKFLEEYDGGVILFDEVDKADVDVKKIVFEGGYSKRFGPHQLPPGWVVWFAGNRAQDRSGSTKELDYCINRRDEIEVTDDVESWVDWAEENNVMGVTIAFASNNPQIVWMDKLPEKQGPYCTPRTLVMADTHLQAVARIMGGTLPDDAATMEEVGGLIGMAACAQYFAMVKLELEMPTYESIVKDPMGVKVSNKPDALMLISYNLAHRLKAEDAGAVLKYVDRMPKDFAATFARSAVKRDYKMVMLPAFQKWASMNAHLMNLINKV